MNGPNVRAALANAGEGITVRDYFAAAVCGAIWRDMPDDMDTGTCATGVAQKAYLVADAMLRERAK